jgi:phosphate uptake regulator
MNKHKRKIQLIAGSTFSISLPKGWVKDMNLRPQQEIIVSEQADKSLIIFPSDPKDVNKSSIEINIEDYGEKLPQILFSLYYYGFEEIILKSSKGISSQIKKSIREVVYDLTGTEIIYEDKNKVTIKIMIKDLDLDIFHVFYRINLLIEASVESIISDLDWKEIKFNEDEVDRLYNLSTKIITSAITNRNILLSSRINNLKIIPSLFLMAKRLENIADGVKNLGDILRKEKSKIKDVRNVFLEISKHLNYSILYLMNNKKEKYNLFQKEREFKSRIRNIKDVLVSNILEEIFRYLINIQEEIIMVDFYRKLSKN